MKFTLSAEQEQFAAALHSLLSTADVPSAARFWAAGDHTSGLVLWRRLAELGVTALAVPERWEGLEAHPVDLTLACQELGHHCIPGPWLESAFVAPVLLSELGDEELCTRLLPGLAAGELIATVAAPPWAPDAPDSDIADVTLRYIPAPSVQLGRKSGRATDLWTDAFRVNIISEIPNLNRTVVNPKIPARSQALDIAALGCSAWLLGAGQALLEMSVDYARSRVQFGRPIGQFQAIKHQLADVHIALEFARPLLYGAAVALGEQSPTVARDVSAAKIACADAAHRAARTGLQVHGAIGYTQECDLSLWLTLVRTLRQAWGTPDQHRARVAAELTGGKSWN
jgi:alkylation response protein AidB-like acyl-CoA dehydrogenase